MDCQKSGCWGWRRCEPIGDGKGRKNRKLLKPDLFSLMSMGFFRFKEDAMVSLQVVLFWGSLDNPQSLANRSKLLEKSRHCSLIYNAIKFLKGGGAY